MKAYTETAPFFLYGLPRFSVRSPMAAEKKRKATETSDHSALLYEVGQHKNKHAFIQLFEHFAPRIKSFLVSGGLDNETADELAQETMLTVWKRAKTYNPEKAKASTWIFTIARNKKIDFFRKTSRTHIVDMELDLIQDNTDTPAQDIQHLQEAAHIAEALKELPKEQASLVHKSFFEGKSHGEIAQETNIPLGTIKSRIRLALERLRGTKKIKDLK